MKSSLYIHIPFCRTKCDYCDFFSVACGEKRIPDEYVDALCSEIKFRAEQSEIDSFSTVYIGGGTPSLLSYAQITAVCRTIYDISHEKPEEFTIELNPDDVSSGLLECLWNNGISRISCGIQALEDNILKSVKRRSSLEKVFFALELIKNEWKGTFSADIIAGLPDQPEEKFLSGLRKLVSYKPHHISMYSLTIEEETPLGKKLESGKLEYDYDAADAMWLKGRVLLESEGYAQYEVSNFCKPGFECRHNMVYWELKDYIGCGSGATGSKYGINGKRFTNTRNISEYIDFWRNGCQKNKIPGDEESVSLETQEFEFFMMGLRTLKGINLSEFKRRFGHKIPEKVFNLIEEWKSKKMMAEKFFDGETFTAMTEEGILFLNTFLQQLI